MKKRSKKKGWEGLPRPSPIPSQIMFIRQLFPDLSVLPGHLPETQEARNREAEILAAAASDQLPPFKAWLGATETRFERGKADELAIRILWDAGYRTVRVIPLVNEITQSEEMLHEFTPQEFPDDDLGPD